ncbi:MAG: multiheme c-type cytochrome [Bryobacteraceae bacterium]
MLPRARRLPAVILGLTLATAGAAKVNILGYWWENPLPYQEVPKGLRSLRASECGVCHQEIYREWKLSTHAHALADLQFQEEIKKSPSSAWLCMNCHTPLENQSPTITVGVEERSTSRPIVRENPRFDPALREEAITCAVCHVRDGVILGPYGDSRAPHPVRKDPKLLTEEICAACHQATAAYSDTLVCTFNTAAEWRESHHARDGKTCSSCHMPEVERPIAVGAKPRPSRRHYFIGSKIPKVMDVPEELREAYKLFPSGLTVEIADPRARRGRVEVDLRLKNALAGHMLPTGDPERFIRIDVYLRSQGRVLEKRSIKIGQEWEWWPAARKLSDNRLKPGEDRTETVRFSAAAWGGVSVEAVVFNVRLTEENARYHNLLGRYPLEAEVLRIRPPGAAW